MPSRCWIAHWAAATPHRCAVVENDTAFSYAELASGIIYLRDRFAAAGVNERSVGIVEVVSPLDGRIAIYALRLLGADAIPVPFRDRATELLRLPGAVSVMSELELAIGVSQARPDPTVPRLLLPTILRDEMRRPREPSGEAFELRGRLHVFSSVTTGRAKRLILANDVEEAINKRRFLREDFTRHTVVHCGNMGPWGVGGYRPPSMMWDLGAMVVFEYGRRSPPDLSSHGVTHFYGVPSGFAAIARERPKDGPLLDNLSAFTQGGPISAPIVRAVRERITPDLTNVYGASELSYAPLRRRLEAGFDGDPSELNWLDPSPNTTLEIVRADGSLCDVGEVGSVRVLIGDDNPQGYEDDAEASERHFRDGAFYPGDLAVRRADGRVRISGREDDVLNFRGSKFVTGPIEARLTDSLNVTEVALLIGQDREGNSTLIVCIESGEPVSKEALRGAAQQLARTGNVAFSMHEAFPRGANGMGKVDRRRLRAQAFDKLGMT